MLYMHLYECFIRRKAMWRKDWPHAIFVTNPLWIHVIRVCMMFPAWHALSIINHMLNYSCPATHVLIMFYSSCRDLLACTRVLMANPRSISVCIVSWEAQSFNYQPLAFTDKAFCLSADDMKHIKRGPCSYRLYRLRATLFWGGFSSLWIIKWN